MDYKKRLDIMQKKGKIKAIFGSISAITFALFLFIMIGFYPITITNSERTDILYIMYYALKSEYKMFLGLALIFLVISFMSFTSIIIGYMLIEKRYENSES